MRIAVTTNGIDLEGEVDARFGRTPKFLLVDTETMSARLVDNPQSLDLTQGAGIQAAQNILVHNPEVVLTGNCGPKAFKVLQAAGVRVVVGVRGKVADAVNAYLAGEIQPAVDANVEGHWM
ncbi:MAG: NifB/NifX family molybdenum-iron cluster-binding protein [Thermodesulfobacteriota bacterium]